jgi:uncharacterized membrane protein
VSLKKNPGEVADVVHRNIQALIDVRREHQQQKSHPILAVERITAFAGSLNAVYANILVVGIWIVINSGLFTGRKPFDPYPFPLLAMFASIEAIFLSTFVLIRQNRAAVLNEKRADLDVQINLLSEHEITRLIQMVDKISVKIGVEQPVNVDELKNDIAPGKVLETIEQAENNSAEQILNSKMKSA